MSYQPGKQQDKWEWSSWVLGRPGYPQQPPKTGVRGQLVEHPFRTMVIVVGAIAVVVFGSYAAFGNPGLTAEHEAVAGTLEFDGAVCCPVYQNVDGEDYIFLPGMKDAGFFSTERSVELAMRVVRLDEEGAPEKITSLDAPVDSILPGSSALVGSTLYIPLGVSDDEEYGIWTVDVSDPESPADGGVIQAERLYRNLATGPNDLLVAHARGYFDLFDVPGEGELELITSYRRPVGGVQRMQVDGDRLFYRESGTNRVRVADFTDPAHPEPLGRYQTQGGRDGRNVRRPDRITSADERLEVTAPEGRFRDFLVDGVHLYVAVSDLGVDIVDVSDPAEPDKLGDIQFDGRAVRTTIMDGELYVVTALEESFQRVAYEAHRFDLTDPASPEQIAMIDGIKAVPGRQAIGTGGGYLFLGLNDSLLVLEPGR